ncbi:unnamed protein product [Lasius platythorax]|uniref:Uncharacterized protein n=1 Tax=Lasius platythorax TaxID=488582 RepID=A0AAV2MYS8_9HYME
MYHLQVCKLANLRHFLTRNDFRPKLRNFLFHSAHLENPPSTEAGLKDSGGGQPLFANYAHGKSTVTRSLLDADGLYQQKELPHEYKLQTQIEIYLWNAWKQAQEKINRLEETLKLIEEKNSDKTIESIQQYETDKEELARETEWIVSKSRKTTKKRKAVSSPEVSPQQQTLTTNQALKVKENRPSPSVNITSIKEYEEVLNVLAMAEV